jgi:hypothetical protein
MNCQFSRIATMSLEINGDLNTCEYDMRGIVWYMRKKVFVRNWR